jgi:hypothetical protein
MAPTWISSCRPSEGSAFGAKRGRAWKRFDNLALATAVFEAELRALFPVEPPRRRRSLEHDSAMHLVAQLLDFGVMSGHVRSLRLSAGVRLSGLGLLFAPALPAGREAGALQGRAERAGAQRQPLAARPALAVAIFFSFAHQAKVQRRWREQEMGGVEGVGAAFIRGNDKAVM